MALSRAQQLDSAADNYASQGKFVKASESRIEAALAYEAASQATADPSASKTLLMLAQRQRANAAVMDRKAEAATAQVKTQQQQNQTSQRTGQLKPRTAALKPAQDTLQASRRQLEGTAQRRLSRTQVWAAQPSSSSASSMLEYSKRSDSPSNTSSPAASIYPEGSFMVLRDDSNDADPFKKFNSAVDALLGQMSQPVAFATLPLDRSPTRSSPVKPTVPTSTNASPSSEDSFYVISSNSDIPQASSSTSAAFLPSRSRTTTPKPSNSSSRHTPVSLSQSKTVEELSCENATLKEALNNLSLQYEQAVSSQNKERESLKQSILTLRTDIRKESDRVLRVPSQSFHQESIDEGPDGEESESKPDLEREVARLKTELAAAKASATKYKSRYDQLREAIKEKRMLKQAADANKQREGQQRQQQTTPAVSITPTSPGKDTVQSALTADPS